MLGDSLALLLAAPLLAVLIVRLGVYEPSWVAQLSESDRGFLFPELAHILAFAGCWLLGGLATGAFEEGAISSENLSKTLRRTWAAGAAALALSLGLFAVLSVSGKLAEAYAAMGFVTQQRVLPNLLDVLVDCQVGNSCLVAWRFGCGVLSSSSEETTAAPLRSRLLLGDTVIAGVVVPCLVVFGLVWTDVYTPGWVAFWSASGGLTAAILAHGALLASCWLLAAGLTGGFTVEFRDLAGTLKRTWTTGSLAVVFLLLSAGASLYADGTRDIFSGDFETSRRVAYVLLDCLQDVLFEAIALTLWRFSYAGLI